MLLGFLNRGGLAFTSFGKKQVKRSHYHCCNDCCAWLWLWTGWSPYIFSILIWHHLTISYSPTWKQTWVGSSIGPMMRSYLQLRTFSRIRMRASIPQESKHCITDGRSVWTAGQTMLTNKPHLVKFDHCITVSLWTFPPTLVHTNTDTFIFLSFFQRSTWKNWIYRKYGIPS